MDEIFEKSLVNSPFPGCKESFREIIGCKEWGKVINMIDRVAQRGDPD